MCTAYMCIELLDFEIWPQSKQILIFDWCEKKLRSFDLILPGASATGKITNVAGAEGGG